MAKGNQGIKWSSLIMGVLLLMLAVVIFTFPIENFYAITWLIGLFVLINGVIQIIYRRKAKALVGGNQNWILFMGIVDILFGLIVIFNVGASSAFFYLHVCILVHFLVLLQDYLRLRVVVA